MSTDARVSSDLSVLEYASRAEDASVKESVVESEKASSMMTERTLQQGSRGRGSFTLRLLSIGLHLIMLLLHLSLAIIYQFHPEHNLVIPLESQSIASTFTTVVLQFVGLIGSTLMLVTTQQLVVSRDLGTRRTLTATHDSDMAWSGLGSSLLALWRQIDLPAHVGGCLLAVIYLGGIAGLHITTPSLFAIQAFNDTVVVTVNATGSPDWQDPSMGGSIFVYGRSAMRTMSLMHSLPNTIGLHDRLVYDVLDDNRGAETVIVPARQYDVDCSHRISSVAAFKVEDLKNEGEEKWILSINIDGSGELSGKTEGINIPVEGSLQVSLIMLDSNNNYFAQVLVTPMNIVDSSGTLAPRATLDPPMTYTYDEDSLQNATAPTRTISDLSVVVCTLDFSNSTVGVDPRSKVPNSEWSPRAPVREVSSVFDNARGTLESFNSVSNIAEVWWRQALSFFDDRIEQYHALDCGDLFCGAFTAFEIYLMNELELSPDLFWEPSKKLDTTSILLADLDRAMSHAAATVFWSLAHALPNEFERDMLIAHWENQQEEDLLKGLPRDPAWTIPTVHGQYDVKGDMPAARLNLVLEPVLAGLAIAVILIVAMVPLWKASGNVLIEEIDSFGLLQVVWVLQRHPDLEKGVGEVSSPTMSNLRRAGMVDMNLIPVS